MPIPERQRKIGGADKRSLGGGRFLHLKHQKEIDQRTDDAKAVNYHISVHRRASGNLSIQQPSHEEGDAGVGQLRRDSFDGKIPTPARLRRDLHDPLVEGRCYETGQQVGNGIQHESKASLRCSRGKQKGRKDGKTY